MTHPLNVAEFISKPAEGLEEFVPVNLMRDTVEDNDWHLGESVWGHTIKVFKAVDTIISLKTAFLTRLVPMKPQLIAYMDTSLGTHSRRALLKVTALLHDIGKVSCLQTGTRGETACPDHAHAGRLLFDKKSGVLPLPLRERGYVAEIIEKHHDADRFISCQNPEQCAAELEKYRQTNAHILVDLLIFYLCDFEGSKINFTVRREKPQIWNQICGIILDVLTRARRSG